MRATSRFISALTAMATGDDADVELRFQRAEVIVVAPEQLGQIDVGRQREAARDDGGFAQPLSLSESITRMCSSFSRAGGTGDGACIRRSCACWFIGKAMTSRILLSPAISMTI